MEYSPICGEDRDTDADTDDGAFVWISINADPLASLVSHRLQSTCLQLMGRPPCRQPLHSLVRASIIMNMWRNKKNAIFFLFIRLGNSTNFLKIW